MRTVRKRVLNRERVRPLIPLPYSQIKDSQFSVHKHGHVDSRESWQGQSHEQNNNSDGINPAW